jgi:hypothetical protein
MAINNPLDELGSALGAGDLGAARAAYQALTGRQVATKAAPKPRSKKPKAAPKPRPKKSKAAKGGAVILVPQAPPAAGEPSLDEMFSAKGQGEGPHDPKYGRKGSLRLGVKENTFKPGGLEMGSAVVDKMLLKGVQPTPRDRDVVDVQTVWVTCDECERRYESDPALVNRRIGNDEDDKVADVCDRCIAGKKGL